MKLTEKVSYLQGLMNGLEINDSTKEGKVLLQMAAILDEMAHGIEDIQGEVDEMTELVDIIDQDLGDVEDALCEDDDDDCDCDCCDDDDDDDDDFDFDDDDELYEITCPTCGDTICLNEEMLDEGSMACPGCGENLEFDFDPDDVEDSDADKD
ncbi:MAG: hypothetical protein RR540_06985 [Oscillospiraceae bacterium]